jgi:hypothetical protein
VFVATLNVLPQKRRPGFHPGPVNKGANMEKTETIKIRLTSNEKKRLFAIAKDSNESVSELVRRQMLQPIVTDSEREELDAFKARTRVISSIGNLLNQLTKASNQGKVVSESRLIEIANALRELQ